MEVFLMPIIIRSRGGHESYTDYDITDSKRRSALVNRITTITREWKATKKPKDKQYHEVRLKFIAIDIYQAWLKMGQVNDVDLVYVWEHIKSKGITLSNAEKSITDPESLFASPSSNKSKHRKQSAYAASETASLADRQVIVVPTQANFEDETYMRNRIRARGRDIQEHAARRVELFFLLCVMVHNSNHVLTLADTKEQYGAGTPGHRHAACHSSLFPALSDTAAARQLRGAAPGGSLIENTHLEKTLNATVELPDEVNKFDSLCEGNNGENSQGMRRQMLPVLNKVSTGKLDPIEAVSVFYMTMQTFFDGKAAENSANSTARVSSAIKKDIQAFQEIGTFAGTTQDKKGIIAPSNTTLGLWLRLPTSEIAAPDKVNKRIKELQSELQMKLGG